MPSLPFHQQSFYAIEQRSNTESARITDENNKLPSRQSPEISIIIIIIFLGPTSTKPQA